MTAVVVWFVVLASVGALALLDSGVRQLVRGLRRPDEAGAAVRLARGLREVLLVLCGTTIALGYAFDSPAAMGVGAVILAEELYETAVAIWLLERAEA